MLKENINIFADYSCGFFNESIKNFVLKEYFITSQYVTFFYKILLHFSVRLYSCDFDREQTRSFFDKIVVFSSIFLSFLTTGTHNNVIILFIKYNWRKYMSML